MGEPDCCLSCKTAASATIGNRPLRIRTVGGVGGRREYPHASYPIDSRGRVGVRISPDRPHFLPAVMLFRGFGRFLRIYCLSLVYT